MSKREILLTALAATRNDLTRMIRGLDKTAVYSKQDSSQWSIADVLCHLALVEEKYLARLQLVVNEKRPLLPAIHPDQTAHNLASSIEKMLTNFIRAREETLTYLHSLKAGDWQKTAVHELWGDVTFRTLVQHLVDHDTNHLNQIIQIKSDLNG